MKEDKKEFFEKITSLMGEAGRDIINTYIRNEIEEALAFERKTEIKLVTKALYEANENEDVFIKLLNENWGLDRAKARELYRLEKTVKHPIRIIIRYLQNKGYDNSYIKNFMKKHEVEEQLINDPSLWEFTKTPSKLLDKLVKGQTI